MSRDEPRRAARAVRALLGSAALALACLVSCQQGVIGDGVETTVDAQSPASEDASIDRTIDAAAIADAALPDAAPALPDASLPDAPPAPTCDELYGAAPEYILCAEEDTTCAFNARTDGGTCNEMCARFGGTCIEAHDNESTPGTECDAKLASGDDCDTPRSTEICVCSRP